MTRMTRKRAEELVEEKWAHIGTEDWCRSVWFLCDSMPRHLHKDWNAYWLKINTSSHPVVSAYFEDYNPSPKECDFLRLLTVHLFIRHTYKD